MTTIFFHGFLKKEFGEKLKIKLNLNIHFAELLSCIDSIKNGFRKKITDLSKQGKFYYAKQIKNELHIVPVIIGAGIETAIIIAAIAISAAGGLGFAGLITMATWVAIALVAIGTALGAYGSYLSQMKKVKKMIASIKFPDKSTGGSVGSVEAQTKQKYFDNKNNRATQGSMVQIGYGRLKIGSRMAMTSIKTFSTSVSFNEIVIKNSKGEIF